MRANLKLYPFQEEGVDFLIESPHRLLADDMGLGKTVQVIAALNRIQASSVVVVCPAGVKYHWARMIAQWSDTPQNIFVVMNGKSKIPAGATVIILNYELMLRDSIYKQLVNRGANQGYDVVVGDEAHNFRNITAQRTKRMFGKTSFLQYARRKWMLTGTPVLNRPAEFYPILKTLAPECIAPHLSWMEFGQYFCKGKKNVFGWDMSGHSNVAELAKRIAPFMLRRKKEDVLDQLPEKVETIIELLVEPPNSIADTPISTVRRDLAIAKIPESIRYIEMMLDDVDKVVIFAHHREVIHQLRAELQAFNPVIVYGGMTAEQKQDSIDKFVSEESTRIFIAQTLAGGTGIDGLQKVCNYIVFVELDWSPGIMDQAVDRCRRIGQKNTVFVHYLAVPGSLDTAMDSALKYKRSVINTLLSNEEENPVMSNQLQNSVQWMEVAADALQAISQSMHAISNVMQLHGQAMSGNVASAKPAVPAAEEPVKPKAGKAKAAPAPVADPPVNPAPPAPVSMPGVTEEVVRQAAAAFIASTPNRDSNKAIIVGQILPKYGASLLADLKTSDYEAFVTDLKAGVDAYTEKPDDLGI